MICYFKSIWTKGIQKIFGSEFRKEKRNDLKLIMHQVSAIFTKHMNEIRGNRLLFFWNVRSEEKRKEGKGKGRKGG